MKPYKSSLVLALYACLLLALCPLGRAQGMVYPTFSTSHKVTSFKTYYNSSDNTELYSPAMISDSNGTLWAAYYDDSTAYLYIASSTDGKSFTVHSTTISGGSAPTWGIFQGTIYLAVSYISPNINIYSLNTSTGALTLVQEFNTGLIGDHERRPALAEFENASDQDCFYIAWNGDAYDPGSGTEDGQWAHVAASCGTSGVSFPTPAYDDPPISTDYSAGTGMAFNVYNGQLFLTYSDADTEDPQMFGSTNGGSSPTFSDLTGSGGGNGFYGGDPATMTYGSTIYVMYRSAYSQDNLWCIGTYDGSTFGPQYKYGQTLKDSPYLTITPDNVFYQSGFTNFPSSGHYVWLYSGDSATIDPYV